MNSEIFKAWVHSEFLPTVYKHPKSNSLLSKTLIILDNAPLHPATDELANEDVKAFFPPNVRQPMEQGVLEHRKKKYRRFFLSSLILMTDNNEDYGTILKNIGILDILI